MRKKIIIGILIILIIVIIAISTLALFTWTSPNTSLTLEVGEMTDVIFQEGNDIMANNIGPVLNYEDGEITEFAIINNAENEQQAKFYLDISEISNSLKEESFKYILQISTNGTNYTTYKDGNFVNANTGELIISDGDVLPSGKTYYKFIIYIDGNMNNPTSMMNNSLKATLNVNASPPPISGTELVEQIKAMANTGTPDFSQDATTDEGVYAAEDDYGTSYYFRGAVENNYVKFAGFYWRIIRANGNGTLRIIYDGTSAHANGESGSDRQIGRSRFNATYGDNAYVGYMMGIDNQCASTTSCQGSIKTTSYSQAHSNTYDSHIKTVVDNWYKINIQDAGYGDKVADVIYCNDRSIYSGDGYGEIETIYKTVERIMLILGYIPILTCENQNDAFTVDDTSKGNGALTYPVGLITADEVAMAGGKFGSANSSYYLFTDNSFVTMSPAIGTNSGADGFSVSDIDGYFYNFAISNVYSVRPVISLKSSVQLQGDGTMEEPYEVVN